MTAPTVGYISMTAFLVWKTLTFSETLRNRRNFTMENDLEVGIAPFGLFQLKFGGGAHRADGGLFCCRFTSL